MRKIRTLSVLVALGATILAQGPDVIVGSLNGVDSYGSVGSTYAYALGTTSCNVGTLPLQWVAGTPAHPVIGQNIYRLKNGRFELIGLSWLKHGFTALQQTLCGSCTAHPNGTALGVGCSDPYSAGLNGSQGNGPRNEVNATTGVFPYPIAGSYPSGGSFGLIGRRIQCAAADVNPALNVGASYWGEGQYVTADDAAAGNKHNNASYRAMSFAAGTFAASLTGSTIQQLPAIYAWQVADPTVVITTVDDPQTGRFIIAKKVTNLGGGNHHYEFAIHNLNSDRSGRGFTVDFAPGTTISNPGFKDIAYHSGEPYDGTDWPAAINANSISWATTQTYIQNVNANALRWGTLYNFWFDATAASETSKSIELFKPAPCPADPVIPTSVNYTLNSSAPFDNPTLTAPTNGPTGDDSALNVPIGFTFNFYGTNYTTVSISTNGILTLGGASTVFTNACIPSASAPNGMIAAYWDDLNVTAGGTTTYQTLGVAPNRRFVASWNNVQRFGAAADIQNFKIILDETTNKITTSIISSVGGASSGGASATRGIENQTGTSGVQASCNAAGSAVASTSQTYTPVTTVLPSADLAVTGSTGVGGSLTWAINSNGIGAPVVLIASLDPGPLNLGPLGTLNIGLTPGLYAVLADGAGALQPANPADFTDACGDYAITIPLPGGLPGGLVINSQGVVLSPGSNPPPPNGQFHITDPVITNT